MENKGQMRLLLILFCLKRQYYLLEQRRSYDHHSGIRHEYGMKKDGAGQANWGTSTDENSTDKLVLLLFFYFLLIKLLSVLLLCSLFKICSEIEENVNSEGNTSEVGQVF